MAYVSSTNIKVYPTSNRGSGFDPESIYRSEANSVLVNKLITPDKEGSYVITETYDATKPFEFVLGGYYFKIKDPSLVFGTEYDNYYAGIVVDYRSGGKTEEEDVDNKEFSSKVLKNLIGILTDVATPNNCLDNEASNEFTGLYIYHSADDINVSKLTYKLHLLTKSEGQYVVPVLSTIGYDTRLITDFNNPAYNLSDYFTGNGITLPQTNGCFEGKKVNAQEIHTNTIGLKQINYNNKIDFRDDASVGDSTQLIFNKRSVFFGDDYAKLYCNYIDSTKVDLGQAEIVNAKLNDQMSYRSNVNKILLTTSNYGINYKGEMQTLDEIVQHSSSPNVVPAFNEDLIIYSPAHTNWDEHYSRIYPSQSEWDPKANFYERFIELNKKHSIIERNPMVERIRFGGLSTKVYDFPYISVTNFYNAHDNATQPVDQNSFGWTEIGGKPIKEKCIVGPMNEYNVTRYFANKYNSSKLSSDGLTIHNSWKETAPECQRWDDSDTFRFKVSIANINSFIYMNNKGISTNAKNLRDHPGEPSSAEWDASNPRYQISGRFSKTSGLVIGTGFTRLTLDTSPGSLPSDATNVTENYNITHSPIPIIISNGIDPKDFDTDKDLVGTNYQVLLDSQGISHLNNQPYSDERLKYNIHNYYPVNSILDVPVKEFTFKKDNFTTIGFIAQDLQKYFPELVSEDDQGYLMINENKIVYLLLEEVKKLKREVDELKK